MVDPLEDRVRQQVKVDDFRVGGGRGLLPNRRVLRRTKVDAGAVLRNGADAVFPVVLGVLPDPGVDGRNEDVAGGGGVGISRYFSGTTMPAVSFFFVIYAVLLREERQVGLYLEALGDPALVLDAVLFPHGKLFLLDEGNEGDLDRVAKYVIFHPADFPMRDRSVRPRFVDRCGVARDRRTERRHGVDDILRLVMGQVADLNGVVVELF